MLFLLKHTSDKNINIFCGLQFMRNLFFTVGAKRQHYGKNLRGCTFVLYHHIMFLCIGQQ